jgi:transcriptional regulator with XRE-family HTH domain
MGRALRHARERRRLGQLALAQRVGLSQARLADLEAGRGGGAPAEVWFALGEALGLFLRFEFGRDPQAELRDAGHLDIQDLVVRTATPTVWKAAWESRSGSRSIDVRLEDRANQRIVIVECWNTFGDLGEAIRSSDHKMREVADREHGLLWVVRDTKANRELVDRYAKLLDSRFTGSSVEWIRALVVGVPMPNEPGLVWCDVRATRLFARRRGG